MDSQFFGYGMNSPDLAYSSFHPTIPSRPTRLFDSLKFDINNSPNSPFSTHLDSETLSTFTDSTQEQHSSTENNPFGASPSCTSSFETDSYNRRSSPVSQNASTVQNMKYALQELETALMGPDEEAEVTTQNHSFVESKPLESYGAGSRPSYGVHFEKSNRAMEKASLQGVPPVNLKQLLIECAGALSENRFDDFEKWIEKARSVVSITGEPIQRLGAYMVECLVARKGASGTNIYRTLRCREPEGKELLSYMHILYEICPYLKFGYMAANGAIAQACRSEDQIHIIDFQISQGTQWLTLLQALAARPGGPPHVRITGIDDPVSKYARGDSLEAVGRRLAAISEKFNIPVEFHAIPVYASDVTREMLGVRPGEALAVNFPLQLHHIPDESVDVNNPRDGLLRTIKSFSPKVVTLVEQESNTNTAPFFPRFLEALDYYLAMFESIDVALPRDKKERIDVEQQCLAKEIVNVIACEGKEREERHELFGKWKSRFTMAGFRQYPLSSYMNSVIRGLLRSYSEHYKLVEKDGAMLLAWKERNLVSASAWY